MKLTAQFNLRFPPKLRRELDRLAAAEGMKTTLYVRRVLLRHVGMLPPSNGGGNGRAGR